jgi:uncharacterized membrane protein YccC
MLAVRLVPEDRLSAVFVALICCQPSFVSGVKRGWEQLLASAVGVSTSLVLLAVAPHTSWAMGIAIALTYAAGTALRWPYPTLVVALFSSLYMSLLTQSSLQGTALLRCESVALGVVAAIAINLAFSPLIRRANLEVRLRGALVRVQAELAGLHVAVVSRAPEAINVWLAACEPVFEELRQVAGELDDLRAEARMAGGSTRARLGPGIEAVAALEQVLHHALDVGSAVVRLLEDSPEDGPELLKGAGGSLAEALAVLARIEAGDVEGAAAIAERELARLRRRDEEIRPPSAVAERLGPRLILLVGLSELHRQLERLAVAMGGK